MIVAAFLFCLAPLATDGDTVRCGASATRVRIWGVLAVERTEPGHVAATAATQRRSAGGLACSPRGASYNRTVAQCFDGFGRDIARDLLLIDKTVTEACSFTMSKAYPTGYYGTCPLPAPVVP